MAQKITIGTVKFFDPRKGYGFLFTDTGEELFFHADEALNKEKPHAGQKVRYQIGLDGRAVNIVDNEWALTLLSDVIALAIAPSPTSSGRVGISSVPKGQVRQVLRRVAATFGLPMEAKADLLGDGSVACETEYRLGLGEYGIEIYNLKEEQTPDLVGRHESTDWQERISLYRKRASELPSRARKVVEGLTEISPDILRAVRDEVTENYLRELGLR